MLSLLVFLACVTPARHELVEIQLDATRTALSDQQAACREGSTMFQERISALEEEIHARQAQLDLLEDHHGTHETELAALRERYAALLVEATAAPPPPPPKSPKPKTPPEPPPEPKPVLTASVAEMTEALALAEDARFAEKRATERHAKVEERFAPLVAEGFATVERRGADSVIVILAAKLFQENTVALSPRGEDIAKRAAEAMAELDGWDVQIEGHTDASPFHTPELPSNWELGFARGVVVLRALREHGVDAPAHVTSYADTVPRTAPDAPDAARTNARVEIVLSEIPGIETRFAPTPPTPGP